MKATIRRLNRKDWAPCSYCGRPIPPGEGRVWHCARPGKCAAHQHCRDGWHASCLDEKACKKRVVRQHALSQSIRPRSEVQLSLNMELELELEGTR